MKQSLRKVYKLVHPDLFHHDERQRQTNEASFQKLMGYIDQIGGCEDLRGVEGALLKFYFRDASGNIAETEVSLSPLSPLSGEGEREEHFCENMNRLFTALGLEADAKPEGIGALDRGGDLADFLKECVSEAQEKLGAYREHKTKEESLVKKIKEEIGFFCVVTGSHREDERERICKCLSLFAENTEALKKFNVENLALIVSDDWDVSDTGSLTVPFELTLEELQDFLETRLPEARENDARHRSLSDDIKFLGSKVEKKYRLAYFIQAGYGERSSYIPLAENLIRFHEQLKHFDLSGMKMAVADEFSVSDSGMLYIPLNLTLESMADFLEENLEAAKQKAKTYDRLEKEKRKLEKKISRETGVKYVIGSYSVDIDAYISCLERLLKISGFLKNCGMDGVTLYVSDEFEVSGTGTISIRHDFSQKELSTFLESSKIATKELPDLNAKPPKKPAFVSNILKRIQGK